jgi:hypothetical protein
MNQKSVEIESRPAASDVALVCFSGSPGSSKLYSRLFFRSGVFPALTTSCLSLAAIRFPNSGEGIFHEAPA